MNFSLHRLVYLLFLGVLTFTLVWACSRNIDHNATSLKQPLENCRVVQHVMGETCIPRNPQRIVTLWMSTFSSALALGIKPIAYVWIPGEPFPKHLRDKVDGVEFVGSLNEPNLEKILLLKPDLILSNTRLQNIYKPLTDIAPTVVLDYPAPPPYWQKHLEDVAKLLDKEQESKQLIDEYWQRIDKLKQALGDRRKQIQVSVVTINPSYGMFTYGKKHPTSRVLNDIELQRPPGQSGDFFVSNNISQERLFDIDGDVIFISDIGGEAAKKSLEKLQQKPLWRQLKAVQKNQVYLVDSSHWYAFDILAMNAVIDDLFKYLVNTP
ncbi:iron-siderophore ABC transporter substrate-binding protein [Nostoc favosum]|uniref:Iron-siderophore ABC transporter substrate-binding protein n=1 Tax=Nostoc favosum CHAB5714 TaxID=2780399 RepID=A0ABS8I437_9NOSO|nr:iron-siderophore ABC transporter substrate-binding protein [Nostoc favosum]MCC5598817.1 iron-siderophore ABC transporter substrate-binding protein [Nostoc favosum CHAB5714]